MKRPKDDRPAEYYPCQNCRHDVYLNKRDHVWLHAYNGKKECTWEATPDTSIAATLGFAIR